jgi:hypothetical protein
MASATCKVCHDLRPQPDTVVWDMFDTDYLNYIGERQNSVRNCKGCKILLEAGKLLREDFSLGDFLLDYRADKDGRLYLDDQSESNHVVEIFSNTGENATNLFHQFLLKVAKET